MQRQVTNGEFVIAYTLTRKKVKNINLRIRRDGDVAVSAPPYVPTKEIDAFVKSKAPWIAPRQKKAIKRLSVAPPLYDKAQCLKIFTPISDAIFPAFETVLHGEKPQLKVRTMTSLWGSCRVGKKCITLNSYLAQQPKAAIEYVILHEYVHFIHANHQKSFHQTMAQLMPDYKERRQLLKGLL